MKYLGQYIQQFISRFRNDVFLEDVSSGTIASGGNLGLDSNNKIVKANVPTTHDAVTLAGSLDYITLSGQEITRNAIDLAADITGTLSVSNGGTGASILTDNSVLVGNGTNAITAPPNFTFDGDDLILESANLQKPTFTIKNTNNSANPAILSFVKDKGAVGADNDIAGRIDFTSDNDAQEQHPYGNIQASVSAARDGNEEGKIAINVCAFNSGSGAIDGNVITGEGNGDSIVDVTLGAGATSLTTVSGNLTVVSDLTVNGDTVTFESANADDPHVLIKNTNNGTNEGARLDFNKLRADDGVETGQNLGEIHFTGQDSAQNTQSYGYIIGEIDVGTSGQESGQIVMGVANHDGGQATGFKLTGGSQNDEIDAEIGFGTSSVTTVAGDLAVTSDATINGTIELGHASDTTIARSAAGKVTIEGANVQTTQICCTHHNMSLDGSSSTVDYYFPINSLADGSSSGLYYTRVVAAYDGKIVKILLRGNSLPEGSSSNSFGTNSVIYMSRRDHDGSTYYHQTSGFQASETFNGSSQSTIVVPCGVGGANAADWVFEEGDVLGFSLVKNTTATDIDLAATIVWEYTV